MNLREHAGKAINYCIVVALVGIVVVQLWFAGWWNLGSPIGEPGLDPSGDRWAGVVGMIGFVFISPGYFAVKLLRFLHIPTIAFGTLDWLIAFISVPLFWGTLLYCIVQLVRYVRILLKEAKHCAK